MPRRSLVGFGMCLLASGAIVFTGCSNEESASSSAPGSAQVEVAKVDDIANQLPEKIRNTGTLVIGVNIPYAPNEFKDASGKIIGFDVDLMTAVSQVLGVTPDFKEAEFDKIIPAIQAGTFDLGMSSFTDSKARQETVDFTNYFILQSQWAQQAGKAVDPNDACGKRVAVQATTVQETDELPTKSAACVAAGKPGIDIVKYDRQDDATTALVLGNVDAMSADAPVTIYAVGQSGGKIELSGEPFGDALYGWPVAKGSPLATVLQQALQHLIDSGDYQTITENWHVESGAIEQPTINGATS